MPFGDDFNDIDNIIRASAKKCGMEYVRGDLSDKPGSIMPQILHEIERAAVIVADISRLNANVFYELGIAHQIKGPERVVIITQEVGGKEAYDIHQFRQFTYKHNAAGRQALCSKLPELLRKASESSADQEFWNVIKGRLPRTRLIIRDMERLLAKSGKKGLNGTTIRIAAGLSSIAISDNEPSDTKLGDEYRSALIAERNILRKVLLEGARLKAVLNPPRRFTPSMQPERLKVRYQRLIGLFEGRSDITGDTDAAADDVRTFIEQCDFALSPVPMPNVFIIDDLVAYEGMKRGGTGGFEMTHCETSHEGLRELTIQFDQFYDESRCEMKRAYPPDGCLAEQLKEFYKKATSLEKINDERSS